MIIKLRNRKKWHDVFLLIPRYTHWLSVYDEQGYYKETRRGIVWGRMQRKRIEVYRVGPVWDYRERRSLNESS